MCVCVTNKDRVWNLKTRSQNKEEQPSTGSAQLPAPLIPAELLRLCSSALLSFFSPPPGSGPKLRPAWEERRKLGPDWRLHPFFKLGVCFELPLARRRRSSNGGNVETAGRTVWCVSGPFEKVSPSSWCRWGRLKMGFRGSSANSKEHLSVCGEKKGSSDLLCAAGRRRPAATNKLSSDTGSKCFVVASLTSAI